LQLHHINNLGVQHNMPMISYRKAVELSIRKGPSIFHFLSKPFGSV